MGPWPMLTGLLVAMLQKVFLCGHIVHKGILSKTH